MLTAEQVARIATKHTTYYEIHHGEILATVSVRNDGYGNWHAVIVVEAIGMPYETHIFNGADARLPNGSRYNPNKENLRSWIAHKLNELAYAEIGTYGPIREVVDVEEYLFVEENKFLASDKEQ